MPRLQSAWWLVCAVERGNLEFSYDDDGEALPFVERIAYPFIFECPVCGLELEGDELGEFAFPDPIELESDDDPTELYDYEPDEDLFRGR